jgi:hypothetical protein
MSRKEPKSLYHWLQQKLRRISIYWPAKSIAREYAKVLVPKGKLKNGKDKFKTKYICTECHNQGLPNFVHNKEDTQMDHINPVMELDGFTTWDDYLQSLFCEPEGYQCLCKPHHLEKSTKENAKRAELRKAKKLAQ